MSQAIPIPVDCPTCPTAVNIPGPTGPQGAAGANGTDGINALSIVATAFNLPAVGATVDVTVDSTAWMGLNQIVFVASAGKQAYMQATALNVDGITVTLKNLGYTGYAAEGDEIVANATVSPGGVIGAQGAPGVDANPVGTLASQNANNVLITGGVLNGVELQSCFGDQKFVPPLDIFNGGTAADNAADARSSLGLEIGTDVQAYDAKLAALAGLAAGANKIPYFTGANTMALNTITNYILAFLASADTEAVSVLTGIAPGVGRIGPIMTAVDLNSVDDTEITTTNKWFPDYIIRRITLYYPSKAITTAQVAVYTNAAAGGTCIAAPQTVTMAGTTSFVDLTLTAAALSTVITAPSLYLRVTLPEGVVASCQVIVTADHAVVV